MKNFKSSTSKKIKGGFAGIPRVVLDCVDYNSLSPSAVKLLLELARQYRGKNNGDLTVAFSLLKKRGFNSRETISRAKKELESRDLILCTRHGKFQNPGGICSLFAVTWQSIDECDGRHDHPPSFRAPRNF